MRYFNLCSDMSKMKSGRGTVWWDTYSPYVQRLHSELEEEFIRKKVEADMHQEFNRLLDGLLDFVSGKSDIAFPPDISNVKENSNALG